VVLATHMLLLQSNAMQFQAIFKSLMDLRVIVKKHGLKKSLWSTHCRHHWAFLNPAEATY